MSKKPNRAEVVAILVLVAFLGAVGLWVWNQLKEPEVSFVDVWNGRAIAILDGGFDPNDSTVIPRIIHDTSPSFKLKNRLIKAPTNAETFAAEVYGNTKYWPLVTVLNADRLNNVSSTGTFAANVPGLFLVPRKHGRSPDFASFQKDRKDDLQRGYAAWLEMSRKHPCDQTEMEEKAEELELGFAMQMGENQEWLVRQAKEIYGCDEFVPIAVWYSKGCFEGKPALPYLTSP